MLKSYVNNLTKEEIESYAIAAFKRDSIYYVLSDWREILRELDPNNNIDLAQSCWELLEEYQNGFVYYDEDDKRLTDEEVNNLSDDELDYYYIEFKVNDDTWVFDVDECTPNLTMAQLILIDYLKSDQSIDYYNNKEYTAAKFELFAAKKTFTHSAVVDYLINPPEPEPSEEVKKLMKEFEDLLEL